MSNTIERIVTVRDLFRFGSRSEPRRPRIGPQLSDDLIPDEAGMIGPESPPLPGGASTYANVSMAPLSGHYHHLPSGTVLPEELGLMADGCDVLAESDRPDSHHTIYPLVEMTPEQFIELVMGLPWQYGGKKS